MTAVTVTVVLSGVLSGVLSACTDSRGKPNLLGIPLPTFSSSTPEMTEREERQLDVFDRTITNPSDDIDPDTRRQAAEELIAMDRPQATERLADALGSSEPAVVMAVIEAMDTAPEPVEGLLPTATDTLRDVQDEQLEKLSLILPRYGNEALQRVATLARDRSEPPARRIGPIYALADFRSREAAVQLMAIIEQSAEPEPDEIVAATGASLERLTGLPYGADADQWRRWWARLKDEPIEDWLRIMVLHLSRRTSDLEREINALDRENAEIASRLTTAQRELFVSLSADEQLDRLPGLLDDELAPVREFALGRVERRLRDSERIPEPLQEKVAERLNDTDETPGSRLLAARLLNDLNFQGTGYLVAAALAEEKDPEIVTGYLDILARRPNPAALNQILQWVADSVAGEAAANALWTMIESRFVDEEDLPTVRRVVANAMEWRTSPPLVRLNAAIGDDDDRAQSEALLDDGDETVRRAAAEGLAFAGRLEPLLARASDEAVYPFALRLVARGPSEEMTADEALAAIEAMAALEPPPAYRAQWEQSILSVAGTLPVGALRAVDDQLRRHEHVDKRLRADVLAPAVTARGDELSLQQRSVVLLRLAELRTELNDYQGAYEALVWPDGAPTSPEFARVKFRVALLAGRYDDASRISDDLSQWVLVLEDLIDRLPAAAEALNDEIRRRFAAQIQNGGGAELRAAEERLLEQTTAQAGPDPSK